MVEGWAGTASLGMGWAVGADVRSALHVGSPTASLSDSDDRGACCILLVALCLWWHLRTPNQSSYLTPPPKPNLRILPMRWSFSSPSPPDVGVCGDVSSSGGMPRLFCKLVLVIAL